jgi:hypothetical protein
MIIIEQMRKLILMKGMIQDSVVKLVTGLETLVTMDTEHKMVLYPVMTVLG